MPELPEVETIVRALRRDLKGARVHACELARPEILRAQAPDGLGPLVGRRVLDVRRLGKHLILSFSDGQHLVVHLRMTGRLVLCPEPCRHRHRHAFLAGDDRQGRPFALSFVDPRRFGRLILLRPGLLPESAVGPLGTDALRLTEAELRSILGKSRRTIKAVLIDQTRLAGVGNIYADESLHRAGIHPATPAARVTARRVRGLHGALAWVLRRAIARGGSSVRDYVGASGQPGSFQSEHAVYGRQGLPCVTCGTPLRHARIAGRGTVFCPRCQRAPRQLTGERRRGKVSRNLAHAALQGGNP